MTNIIFVKYEIAYPDKYSPHATASEAYWWDSVEQLFNSNQCLLWLSAMLQGAKIRLSGKNTIYDLMLQQAIDFI